MSVSEYLMIPQIILLGIFVIAQTLKNVSNNFLSISRFCLLIYTYNTHIYNINKQNIYLHPSVPSYFHIVLYNFLSQKIQNNYMAWFLVSISLPSLWEAKRLIGEVLIQKKRQNIGSVHFYIKTKHKSLLRMTREEFRRKILWWEANGPSQLSFFFFFSRMFLLTHWNIGFCYNGDKYSFSVTTQNMSTIGDQGRKNCIRIKTIMEVGKERS